MKKNTLLTLSLTALLMLTSCISGNSSSSSEMEGESASSVTTESDEQESSLDSESIAPVKVLTLADSEGETEANLLIGQTRTLVVTAENLAETPTLTVDEPTVVSLVDDTITALSHGEATITATADGLSATYKVTVAERVINIVGAPASMELGDEVEIEVTLAGFEDGVEAEVKVAEEYEGVATITPANDGKYLLAALDVGPVEIVAAAPGVEARKTIDVFGAYIAEGEVLHVGLGEPGEIHFNYYTDEIVTPSFASDDTDVAIVDGDEYGTGATIVGVGLGEATITATIGTRQATIRIHVDGVSVEEEAMTIMESTSAKIEATQHGGEGLSFVSSDPEVATVDETGLVTGVGIGEATITVSNGLDDVVVAVEVVEYVPNIIEGILSLPTSYKAEIEFTDYVMPTHEGKTTADAVNFLPDDTGRMTLTKQFFDNIGGNTPVGYVKFHIEEEGVYRLFNNGAEGLRFGYDLDANDFYAINEEGEAVRDNAFAIEAGSKSDIGSSNVEAYSDYVDGSYNFYFEKTLAKGDYIIGLKRFGNSVDAAYTEFGIIKKGATAADEKTFGKPVEEELVPDTYTASFENVEGVGFICDYLHIAWIYANPIELNGDTYYYAYATNLVDGVYQAKSTDSPIGFTTGGDIVVSTSSDMQYWHFGLSGIVYDLFNSEDLAFLGLDEETGNYGFYMSVEDDSVLDYVAWALGIDALVSGVTFNVAYDGTIVSIVYDLEVGDKLIEAELTISETHETSTPFAMYDVTNEGEFVGEGGAEQEW